VIQLNILEEDRSKTMIYDQLKQEMPTMADLVRAFPDPLQPRVLEVLLESFGGASADPGKAEVQADVPREERLTSAGSRPRRKAVQRKSAQMVKDLNLRDQNGLPSFKTFVEEKAPKPNVQFNTVAVYYLTKVLNVAEVGENHLYTCYKEASRPVPGNLAQSIYDASGSRYGYLDASNFGALRVSVRGENLVEHELPAR
jgi:hypothetical protein